MRLIISIFLILGLLLITGLTFLFFDSTTIYIESAESKTSQMTAVFNQIRFFPSKHRDIWMMNQSHTGPHALNESGTAAQAQQWERLAIVVDKLKTPAVASYYQLKPGPLVWEDSLVREQVPYRASCFICHNNGPRAIRPAGASKDAAVGLRDRLKIQVWNLRIKTYGRIHYDSQLDEIDKTAIIPFSYKTEQDVGLLKVSTCVGCHQEEGSFARGALQRQQSGMIHSMVARGEMPPPGFKMSEKERQDLESFLQGF